MANNDSFDNHNGENEEENNRRRLEDSLSSERELNEQLRQNEDIHEENNSYDAERARESDRLNQERDLEKVNRSNAFPRPKKRLDGRSDDESNDPDDEAAHARETVERRKESLSDKKNGDHLNNAANKLNTGRPKGESPQNQKNATDKVVDKFTDASDRLDPFKNHPKKKKSTESNPVDAAKLRAEKKRDRSPAALLGSGIAANQSDSSKKKKNGKKDKEEEEKKKPGSSKFGEESENSGGGSDGASGYSSITISKPAKQLLTMGSIIIALIFLIVISTPASSMMGGSDEESLAAIMGGVAEEDENRLLEDAAAVQNALRCMSSDSAPSSDSALNATGGTLFIPNPDGADKVEEVANFDQNQVMHAQEIVAVGKEMGVSEKGLKTGLLVSVEESRYINMSNDGSGSNGALAADQDGAEIARSMDSPFNEGLPSEHGFSHNGDHGSVGIFQQQVPWWGSVDELMNPRIAASKFFEKLKELDYESMDPAMAGQATQRSWDSSGNNYRRHEPEVEPLWEKIKDTPEGFNKDYYKASGRSEKAGQREDQSRDIEMKAQVTVLAQGSNSKKELETTDAVQENGQNVNSVRGARITAHRWPVIDTIGGYREGDPQDHGKGDATDIMIPDYSGAGSKTGDEIAQFFIDNNKELKVNYVIWKQRIYQPGAGDNWQPMEDRGSETQNHFDHVHVSYFPSEKYSDQPIYDIDASGGGSSDSSDSSSNSDVDAEDISPNQNASGVTQSNPCDSYIPQSAAGADKPDESAMVDEEKPSSKGNEEELGFREE